MTTLAPGVYADLDMPSYLAIKAVNAGLLTTLLTECPRKAWFESVFNPEPPPADDTEESDIGTVAHAILLEGSAACVEVIDPLDHPAEKTGAIPAGFTNKSIRAARDLVRLAGKIPILKPKFAAIEAMVSSANQFIGSLRASEPAIWRAFQPEGGNSEIVLCWEDAVGGILCKARCDRLSADRGVIVNVKTTSASVEPDRFGRVALPDHYVSGSFYVRGAYACFGIEPAHVYLCIEQKPPHLCSLIGLDPAWLDLGNQKVKAGLRQWQECVASGVFPGYPPRVCYPELPAWEIPKWEEKQIDDGIAYGSQG